MALGVSWLLFALLASSLLGTIDAARAEPKICPGMRPLLGDRFDKEIFPNDEAAYYFGMPFVEALQTQYTGCEVIDGNFYIAHIIGIRQVDLDQILRTIKVINGFLHIHAVDLNIMLPNLRAIRANNLTGPDPTHLEYAVFVEGFGGQNIVMPRLMDVRRGKWGVRHSPKLRGWNPLYRTFRPGLFSHGSLKNGRGYVEVVDDPDKKKYPRSFEKDTGDEGCHTRNPRHYCFNLETLQKNPRLEECDAKCGADSFCHVDDDGNAQCCDAVATGDTCLGACYTDSSGTLACNACNATLYELWDATSGQPKCAQCNAACDGYFKDNGTACTTKERRFGSICLRNADGSDRDCPAMVMKHRQENSCHFKCPFGSAHDRYSQISWGCVKCPMWKVDEVSKAFTPSCMHECPLFGVLSMFNIRNLYPDAQEFRLAHFDPYSYPDYSENESSFRDCDIIVGDLSVDYRTTSSPYPGTRLAPDHLLILSRMQYIMGDVVIRDADLLSAAFLRVLTTVHGKLQITRNAQLLSIDLSWASEVCRKTHFKEIAEDDPSLVPATLQAKCRTESYISNNGKWINPVPKAEWRSAGFVPEGAGPDKWYLVEHKRSPDEADVIGWVRIDGSDNARYTAGAYISTVDGANCTKPNETQPHKWIVISGSCAGWQGGCRREKYEVFKPTGKNHQAYWPCRPDVECTRWWYGSSYCRHCSTGCKALGYSAPSCNTTSADDCFQCAYFRMPALRDRPDQRVCTPDNKCLAGFYASGEKSKSETVEIWFRTYSIKVQVGEEELCVKCHEQCLECNGSGKLFHAKGCTRCDVVYLDSEGKETCMRAKKRDDCAPGQENCELRDVAGLEDVDMQTAPTPPAA